MTRTRQLLQEHLFERAPILGALLDRDLRIVEANERFRRIFPQWSGRHCFELLFGRTTPCAVCHARKTLEDGRARVTEVCLPVAAAHDAGLVTRVVAVPDPSSGTIGYVAWMGTAAVEAESLQRENELLFERALCYMAVLDRDLRIVRANRRLREAFGAKRGQECYRVYRKRTAPCERCPAVRAFADGREHTARQVGTDAGGREIHYLTTAAPLAVGPGGDDDPRPAYVMEMSLDVGGALPAALGAAQGSPSRTAP